jgi:hypothetical protein
LITASSNQLPPGETGEAWFWFEELVADGLQFVLGRRVARRGGLRRGLRVSDMIAQLPEFELLVVDAKASARGFDASISNLRALVEYTNATKQAQAGNPVVSALVVSSSFSQDRQALQEVSTEFLSYTAVPVTFLTAETLGDLVDDFRNSPTFRNGLRWRRVFSGGLVTIEDLRRLISMATLLRVEPQGA